MERKFIPLIEQFEQSKIYKDKLAARGGSAIKINEGFSEDDIREYTDKMRDFAMVMNNMKNYESFSKDKKIGSVIDKLSAGINEIILYIQNLDNLDTESNQDPETLKDNQDKEQTPPAVEPIDNNHTAEEPINNDMPSTESAAPAEGSTNGSTGDELELK
jgi:hypothetical protein